MKAAIYARVSTDDQDCQIQLDKTREHARRWGWDVLEYVEKLSGKEGNHRPQLDKLLGAAARRDFEAVLVWKLDRFGRSTLDTLTNVKGLGAAGVRFVALYEGIDTTDQSPVGKFTLTIFAAVAELERSFIVERTQSGFQAYRQAYAAGDVGKGRHSKSGKDLPVGRPTKVFDRRRALELRAQGLSVRAIANSLGISLGTTHRALAAAL